MDLVIPETSEVTVPELQGGIAQRCSFKLL